MKMRRYLKDLFLFGAMCVVLYPLLIVAWSILLPGAYLKNVKHPLGGNGHMHTRMKELGNQGPVDVVFLGSSHTYRGFDPRIWEARGFSSFNLGSSSQSPVQTELLVKEFIDQLQPRLVIFEVYGVLGNLDGVESALDLIANRKIDLGTIKMVLRVKNMLAFNSLIYGSARKLLGVDKNFTEPQLNPPDKYIPGGFVEHDSAPVAATSASQWTQGTPKAFQWMAFQRTIALLQQHGCRVVFVEAPTTSAFHQELHASPSEVDLWLQEQPNFLDMNRMPGLADSVHFYDRHHMYQSGVDLFNNTLIDTLGSLDLLPAAR